MVTPGFCYGLGDLLLQLGPVFFLYPEIHYVIKYLPFSRYRIKEPEIITDVPHRLEAGQDLPVLLLVKDANRFPVRLHDLSITITSSKTSATQSVSLDEQVEALFWHRVIMVKIPNSFRGDFISIETLFRYESGGRMREGRSDNIPGVSHKPFRVFAACDALPKKKNWHYGDLHFHSDFTTDQVEFGAPITSAVAMAHAVGLDFICVTDHSYDLDDVEGNYLVNDPKLRKWHRLQKEVAQINLQEKLVVIAGEEVSVQNSCGRNVHCLVLGNSEYLPGSGDSGERWFQMDSELTLAEAVSRKKGHAVAIAAHPMERPPLMERMLFNRGYWLLEDCEQVNRLQILNGQDNAAFRAGLAAWRKLLLKGKQAYIYAGNDAHGNFNRLRQIRWPMFSIEEREDFQPFGWAKTAVFNDVPNTQEALLNALGAGHAVITNGPLLTFEISNELGSIFQIGDVLTGHRFDMTIDVRSSGEFGRLEKICIWIGQIKGTESEWFVEKPLSYEWKKVLRLPPLKNVFVRAEAHSDRGLFCYTNPAWIPA